MLFMLAGGFLYLLRTEFMPYHAIAVGKSWEQIEPSFQILLLAFIRLAGGATIASVLAMGIIHFIPFRQQNRWAQWAVPVIGIITCLTALYPTITVTLNTPANPPWFAIIINMVLFITGLIISLEPKEKHIPV